MSLNPVGCMRPSAFIHLGIQFPKIAACVAAAGVAGITLTQPVVKNIYHYCNEPTAAHLRVLPVPLRTKIDAVCHCLDTECSTKKIY